MSYYGNPPANYYASAGHSMGNYEGWIRYRFTSTTPNPIALYQPMYMDFSVSDPHEAPRNNNTVTAATLFSPNFTTDYYAIQQHQQQQSSVFTILYYDHVSTFIHI